MAETYGQRLASLDPDTGKRPQSRIGNAGNARSLVGRLKYEDQTRMYRYTSMMGLLDGNPPWPHQKLVDIGQGHRANFNLRESEGIVDTAKTPYYDLVFEVPGFARITFDVEGVEAHIRKEWDDHASEEYTDTLQAWSGFDQQIQLHQWQFVVHGVGPLFWPHGFSWYSEATKVRKVLVPQETKANVDDLELVVVLHSWRADELERYIGGGDNDNKDYNGWNVPLCRQAIIDCALREMRQEYGIENYDLFQRAIRTGDLYYGIHRSDRIYVASLFVREFGGKVSHYVITDTYLSTEDEKTYESIDEEEGYLYKRKNKYDDFSQVICPFFFDTGPDGTWHSVKGLGPKIYDFCDVSNRTFCQMLDGSVIGSGITLEAQDANALEETQIALVGGATVVSPGYKVVQTRIAESLNGAMAMRRELQNTLQSNTGSYRQRVAEERSMNEPTLGQAQMNWQQSAILNKGSTNRYYTSLDRFHSETVRRLLDPAAQNENVPGYKAAKKFVEGCMRRGIPEEILKWKYILKVRSERSLGYGSPQLRDMATKELVNMIPLMDEVSRNHALRARAAALPGIGQSQVDSYFPKIELKGVPDAHAAFATMENNALRQQGGKALVEPRQNHAIHFDVHGKDVQEHLQDPQASPVEKFIHAEQAGAHMAQHLEKLKGDPTRKGEVKQKEKQLHDLSKETDRLHQNIQEMAQAQIKALPPPQQQPDPKVIKAQGDVKLKTEAQQVKHALKAQDQKFKQQLADKKAAGEERRQNMRAVGEARRAAARPTQPPA